MPPTTPPAVGRLSFEVSFPPSAHGGPITGRVFVMSHARRPRAAAADRPHRRAVLRPRCRASRAGAPATIDGTDLGTPVADMAEIPPGDYWVQAFVNVYSEFKRADGHVLWMHDDQWEGQNWNRSPGNIYGAPRRSTSIRSAGARSSS